MLHFIKENVSVSPSECRYRACPNQRMKGYKLHYEKIRCKESFDAYNPIC